MCSTAVIMLTFIAEEGIIFSLRDLTIIFNLNNEKRKKRDGIKWYYVAQKILNGADNNFAILTPWIRDGTNLFCLEYGE